MSHYTRDYTSLSREQADEQAIADMQDYLSDRQWNALIEMATSPEYTLQQIQFGFTITGVRGYPCSAFLRKYRLAEYREWMHGGDDPVMTDEAGFPIPE